MSTQFRHLQHMQIHVLTHTQQRKHAVKTKHEGLSKLCGCLPASALMFVTAQTVQAGCSSAASLTQITTATDDKHANPTSSLQVEVYSLTGVQYMQKRALHCHDMLQHTVIRFGSMPAMLYHKYTVQI
jgi:hypothetical protein